MPRSRPRAIFTRIGGIVASVVLVLWGAATLAFVAFRVIPGDPVEVMLGPQAQVGDAVKAAMRSDLGLDRPVVEQYASFIARLARGDLGESYQLRLPVTEVIGASSGRRCSCRHSPWSSRWCWRWHPLCSFAGGPVVRWHPGSSSWCCRRRCSGRASCC